MKIDIAEHKRHVERYAERKHIFDTYAKQLEEVLNKACKAFCPYGIVQTRTKTLESYAEKVARKFHKYKDPVNQLTDLCGGRVITHTLSEVTKFCEYIEENFIIDEANSLDVISRLSENEFGYRSIHYVVQIGKNPIEGVEFSPQIGDAKAEIQVRTLLQHAWADVTHDRVYKTSYQVDKEKLRESAMLAALLENADLRFNRIVNDLDWYKGYNNIKLSDVEITKEIEILESIISSIDNVEKQNELVFKIVDLEKKRGNWEGIIQRLTPLLNTFGDKESKGYYEVANAIYEEGSDSSEIDYNPVIKLMNKALSDEFFAEGSYLLAEILHNQGNIEKATLELYEKAHELKPQNPFYHVAYIILLLEINDKGYIMNALKDELMKCKKECEYLIRAKINLMDSWLLYAKINMYTGRYKKCTSSYLKAFRIAKSKDEKLTLRMIEREIRACRAMDKHKKHPAYIEIEKLLFLFKYALNLGKMDTQPSTLYDKNKQLTILCSADIQYDDFKNIFSGLLNGYKGVLIFNSDDEGLSQRLWKIEGSGFTLSGYTGSGSNISCIQYWTDIILSSICPKDVCFIYFDDDQSSVFECRLAKSLGCTIRKYSSDIIIKDLTKLDVYDNAIMKTEEIFNQTMKQGSEVKNIISKFLLAQFSQYLAEENIGGLQSMLSGQPLSSWLNTDILSLAEIESNIYQRLYNIDDEISKTLRDYIVEQAEEYNEIFNCILEIIC